MSNDGNDGRWCKWKPEVYCQEYHCDCCNINPYNDSMEWMNIEEYYREVVDRTIMPTKLLHAMRIN